MLLTTIKEQNNSLRWGHQYNSILVEELYPGIHHKYFCTKSKNTSGFHSLRIHQVSSLSLSHSKVWYVILGYGTECQANCFVSNGRSRTIANQLSRA